MLGSSPAGIIRPLRLMVRTAASQAANAEFKSRRGHMSDDTLYKHLSLTDVIEHIGKAGTIK